MDVNSRVNTARDMRLNQARRTFCSMAWYGAQHSHGRVPGGLRWRLQWARCHACIMLPITSAFTTRTLRPAIKSNDEVTSKSVARRVPAVDGYACLCTNCIKSKRVRPPSSSHLYDPQVMHRVPNLTGKRKGKTNYCSKGSWKIVSTTKYTHKVR